jgi:iron complex outermembrane receptor protein
MACSAVPAFAQDDATELERIEVTGSRIKRTELEGNAPVLTIDRKDIEQTGLSTIGDILQELTTSGSSLNTQVQFERQLRLSA